MQSIWKFIRLTAVSILLTGAANAVPVVLYSNGPINGTIGGWQINTSGLPATFIANSFSISQSFSLTSVVFGVQTQTGDPVPTVLDFFIQSNTANDPFQAANPNIETGTVAISILSTISTNVPVTFGAGRFDIYQASINLSGATYAAGNYWLGLGTGSTPGGPTNFFLDINNGPSVAFHSLAVLNNLDNLLGPGTSGSTSFAVFGESVPEIAPGTATLPLTFLAFSLLGLASSGRKQTR